MSDVLGPVTIVCGKKKRMTFYECPDDLCSMLDLAKIADLVLLMVDGSFGFEMETFEFLNMCQVHGFPKVMGVMTHLDKMRDNKSLNNMKKKIKARFWTEIYDGAKMFFMSGVINRKYLKNDIKNMSLYLTRMKFRPLVWRNTHPYVLVDRVEDITHPTIIQNDPRSDRTIVFCGYVRGSHLRANMKLHLIGCGDYDVDSITLLEDPCPLPDQDKMVSKSKDDDGNKVKVVNRKSLKSNKASLLYAPMANMGSLTYDQDATYIDLSHVNYTKAAMIDPAFRAPSLGEEKEESDEENEAIRRQREMNAQMGYFVSPETRELTDNQKLLQSLQDIDKRVDEEIDRSEFQSR